MVGEFMDMQVRSPYSRLRFVAIHAEHKRSPLRPPREPLGWPRHRQRSHGKAPSPALRILMLPEEPGCRNGVQGWQTDVRHALTRFPLMGNLPRDYLAPVHCRGSSPEARFTP